MCILFCYLHDDDKHDLGYDLIVLSNRDEDFHRPALPAHVWKATTFALGGQDQTLAREGGTWLCLNTVHRRIGVLLNLPSRILEEKKANAQSRGFLVPDFVNDPAMTLDAYMDELQTTRANYTGFNLLALEQQKESHKWRATYINNCSSMSAPIEIRSPLFGLSNHVYGMQFAFEKTRHGCRSLESILADLTANHTKAITDEKELIRRLRDLLADSQTFSDDSNLKTTYAHYAPEARQQISAIHVNPTDTASTYGTRTSTIILVRRDQSGLFIERTLSNPLVDASQWTEQIWQFHLNNPHEPPRIMNK